MQYMQPVVLAVLGAGSVRCSPAIIGALGSYYGERPLEVRFYDPDAERLDLFDRLARVVFEDTSVEHSILSLDDPQEVLEGADLVVVALDDHGARKFLKLRPGTESPEVLRRAVRSLTEMIPEGALVLSLLSPEVTIPHETYYRLDWPPALEEKEWVSVPFQVLRWIHREEAFFDLLNAHEKSPLKRWLDDPSTAEPVIGRSAG